MPAENLNHILQQNINNKDLRGMKDEYAEKNCPLPDDSSRESPG